uniref:uncharacterized protein LOC122601665 n=1 Tax=Erigeron canadensis TaxID=72917 RepID=UPI001CB9A058|nr:uncharacterized protein LOC122601665 [Erigeron canadensis]
MNKFPKQNEVRQMIRENQLCACAILVTHVSRDQLNKLCGSVFQSWSWNSNASLCIKGARIVLGWNPDVVDVMMISQIDQVMHTQFVFKADRRSFFCSFVYAHNKYIDRRELWKNLVVHKQFVKNKPWSIMGDFNATLNLEDKALGMSSLDIAMREFRDCIETIEVVDVNSVGLHFTWNQKPKGMDDQLKKIDRVLANVEFMDIFMGATAIFQPYRVSDHTPSVLRIPMKIKFRPKPFKISNLLLHNEKFWDTVSTTWKEVIIGHHSFILVKKLKALKSPLRKLLYSHGNIHTNVSKLRVELDEVQKALDKEPHNQMLKEEEAAYLHAFNDALLTEEHFLKQKAKVEWLKVGDSNSAYFHKVVKSRVQRRRIDVIMDPNGNLLDGDGLITAFLNHYELFLGRAGRVTPLNHENLFNKKLSTEVADHMIIPVEDDEVKDVIFAMGNDKSL